MGPTSLCAIPTPGVRPLGFFSPVCLIIANMIGAGVFTTSRFALGDLEGPPTA